MTTPNNQGPFSEGMAQSLIQNLNPIAYHVHQVNLQAGWWTDTKHPRRIELLKAAGFSEGSVLQIHEILGLSDKLNRDPAGLLMLSVSELAEAMEGIRKNLMDDKLPHRKMFEVEIVDCMIRLFDIAGFYDLDLAGAMVEKMAYNARRLDHKLENRLKEGGKAF